MWTLHLFTNTLQISGILKHIFLLKINKSFLLDLIEIKQMKKTLYSIIKLTFVALTWEKNVKFVK